MHSFFPTVYRNIKETMNEAKMFMDIESDSVFSSSP